MKSGFEQMRLNDLLIAIGEKKTKEFLSTFICPLNKDVEEFLKFKAIEFAKQGIGITYIVVASYKERPILVGYYTIANKHITLDPNNMSKAIKKKITRFAVYDKNIKKYIMTAPLIGQLGKNYSSVTKELITGNELLKMACDRVEDVQKAIGGRMVYLECEDHVRLKEFYENYGFVCFGKRVLDKDEEDIISGHYLLQYIKCLKPEYKNLSQDTFDYNELYEMHKIDILYT